MPELILHHYEMSPYAEKIRLILGFKGLAWRAVLQPMVMPKPDLVALTGGYRRIPVLQIGADVYCDTALIAEELDRIAPSPPLHPAGEPAWSEITVGWADQCLFMRAVQYAMAASVDVLPDAFLQDRAAMMRAPPPDRERLRATLPHVRSQLLIALGWLDAALSRTAHVGGDQLSGADFAVYHPLWMISRVPECRSFMAADFPAITAWMKRVGAVGYGSREEMDARAALAVARASEPAAVSASGAGADPTWIAAGDTVSATPETWGTESVTGTVVAIDRSRVVLAVTGEEVGRVHVHLPRLGFVLDKVSLSTAP
jgi:glutathione S-transferase